MGFACCDPNDNTKDYWSQINKTNITIIKKVWNFVRLYQNVTQTQSEQMLVGKWCWRLAQCRVATSLRCVRDAASAKCNTIKRSKARQACIANSRAPTRKRKDYNQYVKKRREDGIIQNVQLKPQEAGKEFKTKMGTKNKGNRICFASLHKQKKDNNQFKTKNN